MGAIVAKFRREKTTEQILEKLENKIVEIEKYSINTQEQQKHFVFNFLAISVGVYIIAFIIFYFVYFPPTWRDRIIYSVPLLLFPIVIFSLRKVFAWYFQRKLNKNSNKLKALRAEKKKILEDVMDKEKYKVAVSLLARFGDKSYGTRPNISATPKLLTSNTSKSVNTPTLTATSISTVNYQTSYGRNWLGSSSNQLNPSNLPSMSLTPRTTLSSNTNDISIVSKYSQPRQLSLVGNTQQSGQELRRRTPFPVLDWQNKGILDRIVDVLVGDGPKDRFAMICRECYSHNGMALKDDFDFTPFRCAFCNALNPARKKKQVAPPLPTSPLHQDQITLEQKDSTDSSSSSSEELEINDHKSTNEVIEALQDTHLNRRQREDHHSNHDEEIQNDLIDLQNNQNNDNYNGSNDNDNDTDIDHMDVDNDYDHLNVDTSKNIQLSQESNKNEHHDSNHDEHMNKNDSEKLHE